jgi:UDP-N-acetylglucosamine--N-acetylmuramyl-(pentapeptide) pyrophosphoryl-undecaprenol N-acetylglucosamine transferase
MENRLVPKEGFPLYHVTVRGFMRKITLKNIFRNMDAVIKAITSQCKAKKIIADFQPDLVIGTGGYVSWPVLKAAADVGIPTAVHEQNAVCGVTTKMLSKHVDKVMVSFPDTTGVTCPTILTGNPIRPDMLSKSKEARRKEIGITLPYVLSFGGSLGAAPVNEAVYDMMKADRYDNTYVHTHAFGKAGWEAFCKRAEEDKLEQKKNVELKEYIYDMPTRMGAADLVICRAGAITLAELAALGKPAILIPSPYVTNHHQYKNAKVFADVGAAILLEEKNMNGDVLRNTVHQLLSSPDRLSAMSKAAKSLALPDADDKIMEVLEELLH